MTTTRPSESASSPEESNDQPPEAEDARRASPGWRGWLAAAVVAVGIVVVGIVVVNDIGNSGASDAATASGLGGGDVPALAGGPRGGLGPGAGGEVVDIDGATLTVEITDPAGETTTSTVETSADTVVTESLEGSLDELAVGDTVTVTGETTDDGIAATSIDAPGEAAPTNAGLPERGGLPDGSRADDGTLPPGQAPGGATGSAFVMGEITSVDASTITVESAAGGTVVVRVSDDTTVTVSETLSVDDIAVGDTIRATGETAGTVVDATVIRIGDVGPGPGAGPGVPASSQQSLS